MRHILRCWVPLLLVAALRYLDFVLRPSIRSGCPGGRRIR